jgi:hypothetical protein
VILPDRLWNPNLCYAQSYTEATNDPKNMIIKYCTQFPDSVSEGIDVIQDLIGAGIVPSSYYDKTCQDEINSVN